MKLQVNGEPLAIDGPASVRDLVERVEVGGGPVAVERNGQVVPRAEHELTALRDGDVIEIVHFVGGG